MSGNNNILPVAVIFILFGPLRWAWIFWEIRNKWLILDLYSRQVFIYLDPFWFITVFESIAYLKILIYNSLWIDCLFDIRKIAVCFLWLSLSDYYRVTDEALLAETT